MDWLWEFGVLFSGKPLPSVEQDQIFKNVFLNELFVLAYRNENDFWVILSSVPKLSYVVVLAS